MNKIFLVMVSFLSCNSTAELATVPEVDIEKYSGTGYETGRLPNSYEKGLKCVTAAYSIKSNGKIEVLNKGYLPGPAGKWKTAMDHAGMHGLDTQPVLKVEKDCD